MYMWCLPMLAHVSFRGSTGMLSLDTGIYTGRVIMGVLSSSKFDEELHGRAEGVLSPLLQIPGLEHSLHVKSLFYSSFLFGSASL